MQSGLISRRNKNVKKLNSITQQEIIKRSKMKKRTMIRNLKLRRRKSRQYHQMPPLVIKKKIQIALATPPKIPMLRIKTKMTIQC